MSEKRKPSMRTKPKSNMRYRIIAFSLIAIVIAVGYLSQNEKFQGMISEFFLKSTNTELSKSSDKSDTTKETSKNPDSAKEAASSKKKDSAQEAVSSDKPESTKEVTKVPKETDSDTSNLKVHFLDVGQADSILIEADGEFMLVDGGNNDDKDYIINYLSEYGVEKLKYVVATHPHEDHIGGLDNVIEAFSVGKMYAPYVEHTSKTYYNLLEAVLLKDLSMVQPKVGSEVALGNSTVTFLAPVKDYEEDLNNWSVGLKVSNGVHTFIMCSDAEQEAEADMLETGIELKADVIKLGHHGSSTSSSDAFLDAVAPKYAIISCGTNNSYGHPHTETLQKLKERNITLFRTDWNGTIVVESDGNTISWKVEKEN